MWTTCRLSFSAASSYFFEIKAERGATLVSANSDKNIFKRYYRTVDSNLRFGSTDADWSSLALDTISLQCQKQV
jgi:hypothetical protein